MKKISYKIYQSMRCYLDEYSAQEELREEFLSKNNWRLYKNRFGKNSINFEGIDDYIIIPDEKTELLLFFNGTDNSILKDKYDPYFYNRWIKRN